MTTGHDRKTSSPRVVMKIPPPRKLLVVIYHPVAQFAPSFEDCSFDLSDLHHTFLSSSPFMFYYTFCCFKGERRFGKKKKNFCSQKLDTVFNMSKIKKLIKYLLYLA